MRRLSSILLFVIFIADSSQILGQEVIKQSKNVLYLNSYAPTYSWGDSIAKGVVGTFKSRKDITLFVEYLDAKRFGQDNFQMTYQLLKQKFLHSNFNACIASDNDALDFLLQYGDSIAPKVPIVFCGINNPEDYDLLNSRIFGIKEGVDQNAVFQLILSIMPEVEYFYILHDSTTTSLVNIKYIKELEPKYTNKVKFIYVNNIKIDSLPHIVKNFHPNGAIALINLFQDVDKTPVNSDISLETVANNAPIPSFMDSETSFGNGMAGGIINKGVQHGRQTALLAIQFIDNPSFIPEQRVAFPRDYYFFDYKILKKFDINPKLLPEESIIINKPKSFFRVYLKYIIITLGLITLMLVVIFILFINIKQRKKAEKLVVQKLGEIQDKNSRLEKANNLVGEMNTKLESVNKHLVDTNRDLSVAKRKSEDADRLKSAFLSNMSHEIRTPLNSIVGFSSLLSVRDNTDEEQERFIKLINSNSEQLLRLINDILDLSRTEAGEISINEELFPVKELLVEIANNFQHNSKNTEVNIRISEFSLNQPLIIKSDPVRFRQILNNLINNALKFTDKGFIEFGFTLNSSKEATFFVKDTGIGIHPEDQLNVFERFWKRADGKSKIYGGTGLGLAISKKLCEKLGGKIWLESEIGKGTTFYFTHPLFLKNSISFNPPKKTSSTSSSSTNTKIIGNGKTIAIAEDEIDNLNLLKQLLAKYEFNVLSFRNGKELVDYFEFDQELVIELILMDIKMPVMDGIKAAELVKKRKPSIPIVAQTAYALSEDLSKINSTNFDDFITKPINQKLLLEKIRKFL